jgi:hypothetical protein
MGMIVWSGWGILVIVFVVAAFVGDVSLVSFVAGLMGHGTADAPPLIARLVGFLPWVGAAAAAWFMGRKVNTKTEKVLIDPETNEPVTLRTGGGHSLFFIPMQYWAFILLVIGVFAVVALAEPSAL